MLNKIEFVPVVGSTVTLHDVGATSYQVTRAEGMIGPPTVRDVVKTAPGRDGALDDSRFVDARSITLEGEIIGSSVSDVMGKWDTMNAAFQTSLLSRGTLKITMPDSSVRQASVVLVGAAQPSLEGGAAFLQYQVGFRAPDPRWYGTTLKTSDLTIATTLNATSSSANVTNAGNAPSNPTFTWTAGTGRILDNITVTVPTAYSSVSPQGSTIVLEDTAKVNGLAANDYIDCAQRLNKSQANISATTEWPVLYPGTSSWTWKQTTSSGSSSSSTCQMTYRDAWW